MVHMKVIIFSAVCSSEWLVGQTRGWFRSCHQRQPDTFTSLFLVRVHTDEDRTARLHQPLPTPWHGKQGHSRRTNYVIFVHVVMSGFHGASGAAWWNAVHELVRRRQWRQPSRDCWPTYAELRHWIDASRPGELWTGFVFSASILHRCDQMDILLTAQQNYCKCCFCCCRTSLLLKIATFYLRPSKQ